MAVSLATFAIILSSSSLRSQVACTLFGSSWNLQGTFLFPSPRFLASLKLQMRQRASDGGFMMNRMPVRHASFSTDFAAFLDVPTRQCANVVAHDNARLPGKFGGEPLMVRRDDSPGCNRARTTAVKMQFGQYS
jgi:hypothetical protein